MRVRTIVLYGVAGAFALVAVVPAILAAFEVDVPWVLSLGAGVGSLAAFLGGIATTFADRAAQRVIEQATRERRGRVSLRSGRPPLVREWPNPLDWGTHPAAALETEDGDTDRPPEYVPRDIDQELRARLERSDFVLLVGDSTAGKTRCAYEAVRATLPDHALIIPSSTGIEAALDTARRERRSVLWLNDLDKHIRAHADLTREAITALIAPSGRRHCVVVATIRATEESALTATPDDAKQLSTFQRGQDLLARAYRLEVPRLFTATEVERAWESRDPRVVDAVDRADEYGVAEYLANGPRLLAEWDNAWSANTDPHAPSHPRGAALVAAAVDLRRAGYVSPLSRALLEEIHTHYLDERGGGRLRPESSREAWEWALKPRHATTYLLYPAGSADHVELFDYLTDAVRHRTSVDERVPEVVVTTALEYASSDDALSIGRVARSHGRYQLGYQAFRIAYTTNHHLLGEEHQDTLVSRNNLALTLRDLGRLEKAETEHRTELDVCRKVLGEKHQDTLGSRNNLALVIRDLGRYKEAERELRGVLRVSSRTLGKDHQGTVVSRNNLASVLHGLGRFRAAEREFRAVLEACRRTLGEEHQDTLVSRNNLALTLRDLGRIGAAERELREVLDICRRTLGEKHPTTLRSRINLALTFRSLGRLEEAEEEFRAVLGACRRTLGEEHQDTLVSRNNLALTLRDLGRLEDAEREFREVLDVCCRTLGEKHPGTLDSRSHLAAVLHDLGRREEAEEIRNSTTALS